MRITKISVEKLFGMFTYQVSFNLDSRITIIHGPNGSGKTVLLTMLHNLFRRDFTIFHRIPFREFRVEFEQNYGVMSVIKSNSDDSVTSEPRILYKRPNHKEQTYIVKRVTRKDLDFPTRIIDDLIVELEQTDPETWVHMPSGQALSLQEVIERYDKLLPPISSSVKTPNWLKSILENTNLELISTDRLTTNVYPDIDYRYARRIKPLTVKAVETYSRQLAEKIQNTLADYAQRSQSLDRTFPSRLVQKAGQRDIDMTIDEVRQRLEKLEEKSSRLVAAGLLEKADNVPVPTEIDDLTHNVLAVYVPDVEQKLAAFDSMLVRIEALKAIIQKRNFLHKSMHIGEEGFSFETTAGERLTPSDLSSGEQHELVLFYRLLFEVQDDSLILIDEPELSLHIAWQQEFISDLQEIAQLGEFDVVIATHSPDIINDKWGWTVDLGEEINNRS